MKKFVNNVKAAVGNIEHTKDEEAEKLLVDLKGVYSIPSDAKSAAGYIKASVESLLVQMEKLAKVYEKVAEEEGASEETKTLSKEVSEALNKVKTDALTSYKTALESEEVVMKKLAESVAEVKKLEGDRKSKLDKYDVSRVTVEEKEKEYEKKGKDLSESKKYKEEVEERDKRKEAYDEVNTKFKEKAKELIQIKNEEYMKSMTAWAKDTIKFFKEFNAQLETVKV